jgi:hypothetical protein
VADVVVLPCRELIAPSDIAEPLSEYVTVQIRGPCRIVEHFCGVKTCEYACRMRCFAPYIVSGIGVHVWQLKITPLLLIAMKR